MSKTRVAILKGGRSTERKVSLASAREVIKHLDPSRYAVTVFDPQKGLGELFKRHHYFDVVFPVLHGSFGEDGTIQGFLEILTVPYVGSGVLASAVCMNKVVAKAVYRANGLPVAADLVVTRPYDPLKAAKEAEQKLGRPVVVKPVEQGSSVGLTLAANVKQMAAAIEEAWEYGPQVLLEQYVAGRELTCAVLGNTQCQALPVIEIIPGPGHGFFDYDAKYVIGQAQEICPAPLTDEKSKTVQKLALEAHLALNCRGLSRTDFILDEKGRFFLLETNTIPGLTPNSLLPKAAAAAGMSFAELLETLISLAME
jgi:D-alanine-D-alanine ligase